MTKKEMAIDLLGLVEKESRRCEFIWRSRPTPRVGRYVKIRLNKMSAISVVLRKALND